MRYQWLAGLCIATAVSLSVPTAAVAQSPWAAGNTKSSALKWEVGYLALSAIDAAQTIECLSSGACEEANPVWGKRPNAKTVILAKLGLGIGHYFLFDHLNDRDPKMALRLAQISCATQGGVIMLNARFTFR